MKQNLRRIELLDFVSRDFSEYAWSLRTPDRRLEYSGIKYTDQTVQVDEVEEALKKEFEGPGKTSWLPSVAQKNLDRSTSLTFRAILCMP